MQITRQCQLLLVTLMLACQHGWWLYRITGIVSCNAMKGDVNATGGLRVVATCCWLGVMGALHRICCSHEETNCLQLLSLLSFTIQHAMPCIPWNRSVLLAIIVEKSKKCLDFCVTLFLIHLLVCTLYNGIPATWDWWIIHIFSTIAMILLGEYVCSQRELDEIPLLQF